MEMTSAVDLAKVKFDDFSLHVDKVFEMQTGGGVVPLKLTTVTHVGESGRDGGAFSLIFAAPKGPSHPQAIYPVTHPVLGMMEIFLVPVAPAQDGSSYQAIFT